jgi:23S rRNA (guanosine2251-2'-O)-methyltransferase
MEKILILSDIRSVQNVGAIFRTADAIGISKIYLSGITPAPIDRFGRKRSDLAKSALGAEENVPWEQIPSRLPHESEDLVHLLEKLKKENFKIISVEQSENSVDYKDIDLNNPPAGGKIAIVLGNEVDGLSKEILDQSDVIAEIPMQGKKESLNVSVSAGIVLYRLFDR